MITYQIKTGEVKLNDKIVGYGYSGNGTFLNDPTKTDIPDHGPIPQGLWHLGGWEEQHGKLGGIVIHLAPDVTTNTFGRSAFFIHGDNFKVNHTASDGCIILSKELRKELRDSGETQLTVI